jgi:hypothetical protein
MVIKDVLEQLESVVYNPEGIGQNYEYDEIEMLVNIFHFAIAKETAYSHKDKKYL